MQAQSRDTAEKAQVAMRSVISITACAQHAYLIENRAESAEFLRRHVPPHFIDPETNGVERSGGLPIFCRSFGGDGCGGVPAI